MFMEALYYIISTLFLFRRTLSEFWHWFVANVPGDNIDEGEIIFELLFPLVLPEGDGDHRYIKSFILYYTEMLANYFIFDISPKPYSITFISGLVTSYLNNHKDLIILRKEDQRMHAVQICQMEEVPSSND